MKPIGELRYVQQSCVDDAEAAAKITSSVRIFALEDLNVSARERLQTDQPGSQFKSQFFDIMNGGDLRKLLFDNFGGHNVSSIVTEG